MNAASVVFLNLTFERIFAEIEMFFFHSINDSICITISGNNSYYMWIWEKDLN